MLAMIIYLVSFALIVIIDILTTRRMSKAQEKAIDEAMERMDHIAKIYRSHMLMLMSTYEAKLETLVVERKQKEDADDEG